MNKFKEFFADEPFGVSMMILGIFLMIIAVTMDNDPNPNYYEIVREGKVVGYTDHTGVYDNGCIWMSETKEAADDTRKICGNFTIQKIKDRK